MVATSFALCGCGLFQYLAGVVVGGQSLSPCHLMKLREASVARHAPNENLQRLFRRLDSRHLRAAVGPGPVVPVVRDFEELKRSLVTEKDAPPLQNVPFFLRALAKSSRLSFWSTFSRGCILSLSGFSFRLVFRHRWAANLDGGRYLSVSFLDSPFVEWCL